MPNLGTPDTNVFIRKGSVGQAEIEFLDAYSTKDSSFLLHAIHNPSYWRIFKKTLLFSVFKNFVEPKNEDRKPDSLRRAEFLPSNFD